MNYLRTDAYTHVSHDCPISVDMHRVDNLVEITFGDHRFGSDTLRLHLDNLEACDRVIEAVTDARAQLATHLHTKTTRNPAMSQLDSQATTPRVS